MDWQTVCQDPHLQNLPYKVELNEWGQVVMSPASNRHSLLQFAIAKLLDRCTASGKTLVECSVDTPKGTKVADVAWMSDRFFDSFREETPYPQAPEICIEIKSPANSKAEIEEKIELYLSRGALEVWICYADGRLEFYTREGQLKTSRQVPQFPVRVNY